MFADQDNPPRAGAFAFGEPAQLAVRLAQTREDHCIMREEAEPALLAQVSPVLVAFARQVERGAR